MPVDVALAKSFIALVESRHNDFATPHTKGNPVDFSTSPKAVRDLLRDQIGITDTGDQVKPIREEISTLNRISTEKDPEIKQQLMLQWKNKYYTPLIEAKYEIMRHLKRHLKDNKGLLNDITARHIQNKIDEMDIGSEAYTKREKEESNRILSEERSTQRAHRRVRAAARGKQRRAAAGDDEI